MSLFEPSSDTEVVECIRDVLATNSTIDIVGGGTKSGLGRPSTGYHRLCTARMRGITLYEPSELVMGARAGTPLAEVEAVLADKGQMLPFEPMDHRKVFGSRGVPSVASLFAANASGPRRISAGAARDHFLGLTMVNGHGKLVRNGGRVMKNVTGLDLVKLNAGAMGTLGVMTEVIFKVLPRPETSATLVLRGDDPLVGLRAMCAAMGSTAEVGAAAFLSGTGALLRLEGFADAVTERLRRLESVVGPGERIDDDALLWTMVRDVVGVGDPGDELWRISVPPSRTHEVLAVATGACTGLSLDWSGGLIWLAAPAERQIEKVIRPLVGRLSGHATLVRASAERRLEVGVYQPLSTAAMTLTRAVQASFDPAGIFNPGRMYGSLLDAN